MIRLFLFLNIFSTPWFYFNKIEDANTLKIKAAEAYNTHFYGDAITYYEKLLTEYEPNSDLIKLNLAHSYYKAQSYTEASKYYTELSVASETKIRSTAQCQLGIIQHRSKRYKLALFYFKEALRINPDNKIAAYNYEFLKLSLKKEQGEGTNSSGKGNTNSSKRNQENTNNQKRTENKFDADGTSESSIYYRMLYEQQRLSKQRAEKILQYIQEQEMQYYHQIQKHVPKDPNKPDW